MVNRGDEEGKGNYFEFAFVPGKYVRSENRFTTWFSCPVPYHPKAGVRPGKKNHPPSPGSDGKGARDCSAAAGGAAPLPDTWPK